jgi:hypothetical protein
LQWPFTGQFNAHPFQESRPPPLSKREAIYKGQGIPVQNLMEDMPLCSWNIQKQLVAYAVENNTFLQRTVNNLVLNIHVQAWTGS